MSTEKTHTEPQNTPKVWSHTEQKGREVRETSGMD